MKCGILGACSGVDCVLPLGSDMVLMLPSLLHAANHGGMRLNQLLCLSKLFTTSAGLVQDAERLVVARKGWPVKLTSSSLIAAKTGWRRRGFEKTFGRVPG